jgi:putative flippase GtrA
MSTLSGQASRFIVVGLANTIVTGCIFFGLSLFVPVWIAYSLAFGLGIVFVTTVTPRLVFSARPSVSRRLTYGAWYLVVYFVGLACVAFLSEVMHLGRLEVVACSLAATTSLSFVGGRVLFARRMSGEEE